MTERVVSICGARVIAPGTPNPELIEDVEKLLELARSGEISSIAYVTLFYDDLTSYRWVGRMTRGVIGALELVKHSLCAGAIES